MGVSLSRMGCIIMDTWGFLLIILGAIIYLVAKKKSRGWADAGILFFGIGLGIVIGAIWAYAIVQRVLH